jgi:acetylornithine/N-succinyldiaminopimelate aminotransferase
MDIREIDKKYVANTYSRFDIEITGGAGSLLTGSDGKTYIDMGSGIAVNSFGVNDSVWKNAVVAQLNEVQHASNYYYTAPCALLARKLCELTGFSKVFFSNSGAEANECAIKAARKYSHDKYGDGRYTIVTLENSFHGRTITTLSATGQDSFHTHFMPFTEGFVYAKQNDIESVSALLSAGGVCAVILETIQGEGGVVSMGKDFLEAVAKLCGEKDVLLIIDEVQTGNGRTGKLYSYMHYDLKPDIVTTAKGLGGGLPIGATMFSEKTAGVLTAGQHGSTFGGNPVAAAGALSIVSRLDKALLAEVAKKGGYIRSELEGAPGVKSVSGLGLIVGVETEKPAKDVVLALQKRGVLALTAKNNVRLLPALNIPWELLKKALSELKAAAKPE